MKKIQLLFIPITVVFIICFSNVAEAKIWRVNNFSNYNGTTLFGDNLGGTSSFPVFAQLTEAAASNLVSNGSIDTVHLEGTNIFYAGATLHKPMIIIGTGYFLNKNPKVSNTVLESVLYDISFASGSDGSQLIGVHMSNANPEIQIGYGVSNITIKRCEIDYEITVGNGNSNIFVLENYFANIGNSTNQSAIFVSSTAGLPSNFVFDNNICKNILLLSIGSFIYNAEECNNNVFDCPAISGSPSIQMNTTSFKNNILKTAAATVNINSNVASSDVSYNTSSSATNQFGTTNNNIVITDMSTLFVDPATNTTDGHYQLKPGSAPGADGADRGAFGGAAFGDRYTLSGLAPIPVIYDIATSGPTSTNLPVTISARTIK